MLGLKSKLLLKLLSAIEFIGSSILIIADVFIPTICVLGVAAVSFLTRKERFSSLGFKKVEKPLKMILEIFGFMLLWSLFHLSFTMPILNHLTGTTQDMGMFVDLKGNISKTLLLIGATWTLAAFGEEIVYRGYLQKRLTDILGNTKVSLVLIIGLTSLLFGLAHSEQGFIGIVLTFMDAIVYSLLRIRYSNNLWASVLAHGFSNTIGIVTFFLVGPLVGFW